MLELKGVSFSYDKKRQLLQDISLTIGEGEFIAIAGRNGSGKTTLTRLLMTLLKPQSGSFCVDGRDASGYAPADMARYIGYVFQNPDRQIFRDTVRHETAYGPEQLGFAPERITVCVEDALAAVGMTAMADAYPLTLSKGHKQLVAIASALAMQPKYLILDEPTSGLDARQKEALMRLLVSLRRQGRTIILVTHDMELLVRYAARAVVIADGHKVFDGDVRNLFLQDDIAQWGLAEPDMLQISKALAAYGVPPAVTAQELYGYLAKRERKMRYA